MALPDQIEGTKEVLAEIKVIYCCPSRYTPSGPNVKAVNKRAQLLPGEYRKKARDILGVHKKIDPFVFPQFLHQILLKFQNQGQF